MTSEFTAGRRGPTAIHPGVLAAATAVYDALLDLAPVLDQLEEGDEAALSSAARDPDLPPPLLSFLLSDLAAARLDPPFALPPAVDASPLGHLRDALRLTPFETALLALALLPELDARCKATIGYVQRDTRRPCPLLYLALCLFAPDDPAPLRSMHALRPGAPLRVWELLDPPPDGVATIEYPLRLERALHWYLLGDDAPDPELAGLARRAPTAEAAAVDQPEVLGYLLHPAHHAVGPILLYGASAPAALAVALAAARERGQDLLLLDGERLARAGGDGPRLLRRGVREALLRGLLPCVRAAAPLVRRGAPQEEAYRRVLDACPCPVLLLGDGEGEEAYAVGDGDLCAVLIPTPDAPTRRRAWRSGSAPPRGRASRRTRQSCACWRRPPRYAVRPWTRRPLWRTSWPRARASSRPRRTCSGRRAEPCTMGTRRWSRWSRASGGTIWCCPPCNWRSCATCATGCATVRGCARSGTWATARCPASWPCSRARRAPARAWPPRSWPRTWASRSSRWTSRKR